MQVQGATGIQQRPKRIVRTARSRQAFRRDQIRVRQPACPLALLSRQRPVEPVYGALVVGLRDYIDKNRDESKRIQGV